MISVYLYPLFFSILCFLCAFVGERMTVMFFLACLAHEAGHLLLCLIFRIPIRNISVRAGGIVLAGDFSRCSYPKEAAVHLAGIAVNLLSAVILHFSGCHTASQMHLLLGIYNGLPLPGHDGAHFLHTVLTMCDGSGSGRGEQIASGISYFVLAICYLFSAWLFWFGALHHPSGGFRLSGVLFLTVLWYSARMVLCGTEAAQITGKRSKTYKT